MQYRLSARESLHTPLASPFTLHWRVASHSTGEAAHAAHCSPCLQAQLMDLLLALCEPLWVPHALLIVAIQS
jgi:hypothetical protein